MKIECSGCCILASRHFEVYLSTTFRTDTLMISDGQLEVVIKLSARELVT